MEDEIDLKPPISLEGEKLVEWNLKKGREINEKKKKIIPTISQPVNHFLRRIGENFWMHTISPF